MTTSPCVLINTETFHRDGINKVDATQCIKNLISLGYKYGMGFQIFTRTHPKCVASNSAFLLSSLKICKLHTFWSLADIKTGLCGYLRHSRSQLKSLTSSSKLKPMTPTIQCRRDSSTYGPPF